MHPEHRFIGELAYHIWQARAARKEAPNKTGWMPRSSCSPCSVHPMRARLNRPPPRRSTARCRRHFRRAIRLRATVRTSPQQMPTPNGKLPARRARIRPAGHGARNQRKASRVPNHRADQ